MKYRAKKRQTTKICLQPDYNHAKADKKNGALCFLSASRFRICNLDCRIYGETSMIIETQHIAVNPTTNVQQGLQIPGFWFQKKTVQLKTTLCEVTPMY